MPRRMVQGTFLQNFEAQASLYFSGLQGTPLRGCFEQNVCFKGHDAIATRCNRGASRAANYRGAAPDGRFRRVCRVG